MTLPSKNLSYYFISKFSGCTLTLCSSSLFDTVSTNKNGRNEAKHCLQKFNISRVWQTRRRFVVAGFCLYVNVNERVALLKTLETSKHFACFYY